MKKLLFACFLLLFASPAVAACTVGSFEISPKRPTSDDAIELRLAGGCPDGCVPIDQRVRLDGKTIRVEFGSPEGCILIPLQWERRANLGRLPGGTYDVVVSQTGKEMSRQTLTVLDAAAWPFEVLPAVGRAGTEVLLRGVPGCPGFDCGKKGVRFNGVEATALRAAFDGLVATVPSLPEGFADVTVVSPDGALLTAKAAFESTTRFDARDYVRVLFPLAFAGPGAEGSSWTTDNIVRNYGSAGVTTIPAIWIPQGIGTVQAMAIPPGESTRLSTRDSDGGTLLLIPRGLEPFFDFSSHVRDTSRAAQNNGTEMRVVHERDTSSEVRIIRIPADPRFRPRLRVYDIDGNESPVRVVVSYRGNITTTFLQPRRSFVCITTPCEDVAFASLNLPLPANAPATDTVDVIVRSDDDRRLWAFVSVTNNETQQVTTASPQR